MGGIFLWHYPRDRSHWALSSSLIFVEARTFLKTGTQDKSQKKFRNRTLTLSDLYYVLQRFVLPQNPDKFVKSLIRKLFLNLSELISS